jgi:hypothetical protein
MSEERRRRQQQREAAAMPSMKSRKSIIWIVIIAVLAAAYCAFWYYKNHRYDAFAKCLASKQAKMYGLYWCPHCIEQKEEFGKAFQYVPYVECAIKGSREVAPECKAAGAKNFPTWQFPGQPLHEGILSLDELSARTGCTLP